MLFCFGSFAVVSVFPGIGIILSWVNHSEPAIYIPFHTNAHTYVPAVCENTVPTKCQLTSEGLAKSGEYIRIRILYSIYGITPESGERDRESIRTEPTDPTFDWYFGCAVCCRAAESHMSQINILLLFRVPVEFSIQILVAIQTELKSNTNVCTYV